MLGLLSHRVLLRRDVLQQLPGERPLRRVLRVHRPGAQRAGVLEPVLYRRREHHRYRW